MQAVKKKKDVGVGKIINTAQGVRLPPPRLEPVDQHNGLPLLMRLRDSAS